MEPKYWLAVGAAFVALNLLYGGTVVLSYARYGRDEEGAPALALALLDSPIGYLVVVVLVLTVGGAVSLRHQGEL